MAEASEAQGAPEAGETPEVDYSPVVDRVGQLVNDRLGQFQQDILSRLPSNEEPEPEPDDPWAGLLGEPDPEPEPAGLDPQALQHAVQQAIEQGIEQRLGPVYEQIDTLRTTHDLGLLYEQHPDLKDPEVRKATGEAVQQLAAGIEQRYGAEVAQALANDPDIIATVHRSLAGAQNAAAEVAATGGAAQLEGGGGASPNVEQPNIVQQVMDARRSLPKGFR